MLASVRYDFAIGKKQGEVIEMNEAEKKHRKAVEALGYALNAKKKCEAKLENIICERRGIAMNISNGADAIEKLNELAKEYQTTVFLRDSFIDAITPLEAIRDSADNNLHREQKRNMSKATLGRSGHRSA